MVSPIRSRSSQRVRIGTIAIDLASFDQAIGHIDALVRAGKGGVVFTPNVDHIVVAESNARFREAYGRANLVLADGMPVVWLGRLLGYPQLEKVSGADMLLPLMKRAALRGWRVYLLGATPQVGETASNLLTAQGVTVVGRSSPSIDSDGNVAAGVLEAVAVARADLVLVALGTPKQELWIDKASNRLTPAVLVGCGAALDFLVGKQRRAPKSVTRAGFEWLYRLCHEPRRLWRRYLIQDARFAKIALTTWWFS